MVGRRSDAGVLSPGVRRRRTVGLSAGPETRPAPLRAVHDRRRPAAPGVGRAARAPPAGRRPRPRARGDGRQLPGTRHQGVGVRRRVQAVGGAAHERRGHGGQQQRCGRRDGHRPGDAGQVSAGLQMVNYPGRPFFSTPPTGSVTVSGNATAGGARINLRLSAPTMLSPKKISV